jgi:protein-S-isoprenylcysteine O-methyltransferase Ste14
MMLKLETKIPPPVVAALLLALMWLLSTALPRVQVPTSPRLFVAIVVALIGAAFSIAGAVSFRRARTTVDPMHPERASALVTSGVYRITRNPMYVALLLLLLAWAIYLASPVSLAGPVVFIAFINRFQIEPEERVLAGLFGNPYVAYKSRVRRWL